jgi:hypothetical protein
MGQIIKQPNGKYCIFSSIVDNFTHYDMSEDDIIELWSDTERRNVAKKVKDKITMLENGEKPYYQFTQTYEESILLIKEIHGTEEAEEVRQTIEH